MQKLIKDIGFAWVISSKPVSKQTISAFKSAFSLNKKLFSRTPSKFRIIFCETEKEFKKASKYYYHKWGSATVLRDNTLVARSPEFIEKIGRWKKRDFPSIISHEMNHVFWNDFYRATCKPAWLLEGFACYAGRNFAASAKELRQLIKKYNVDYSILHYRYLARKFEKGHIPIYPVWAAFTRFIVGKYSARKIVKLMDEYAKKLTRKHYDLVFKRLFRKTEKDLFRQFIQAVK